MMDKSAVHHQASFLETYKRTTISIAEDQKYTSGDLQSVSELTQASRFVQDVKTLWLLQAENRLLFPDCSRYVQDQAFIF
jgi:hypothetical protein